MTSRETQAEDPEDVSEAPKPLLFSISFARLAELKRSAIVLLAARRVPTCPSLDLPDTELTDPQKLVDEIAEHYEDGEGFITSEMTIQEILFRTLLTRRNAPTLLSDLHYELTERWSTPVRPINVTEDGLRVILESDNYYGFATVEPK
tara:strand:- start:41 stop:484 length:444 start_codon:yes stop_codon:yes gene_type:complete